MASIPQIPLQALNLRNVTKARGASGAAEGGCTGCIMVVPGLMIGGIFCIIPFGFIIGFPVIIVSIFFPLAGLAAGGTPMGTVECPYCGTTHTGVVLQSSGTPNYKKCTHCEGRMQIPPYIPNQVDSQNSDAVNIKEREVIFPSTLPPRLPENKLKS